MHSTVRSVAMVVAAILSACAQPATEQSGSAQDSAAAQMLNVTADLLGDVSQVEEKILGLAKAIPETKYSWRPMAGVRSVGEVLLHVAGDNYLMPAALGNVPDSATGIKGDDYKTAQAFESRKLGKDATIAELEKSFAFLKKTMTDAPTARLGEKVTMFGQDMTHQQTWIMATTHLHEHLGQLIAYARSNSIKPPWS